MDPSIRNLMEERAAIDRQELYWHSIAQDIAEEFSCPVSEIEKMLRAEDIAVAVHFMLTQPRRAVVNQISVTQRVREE